LEVVWYQNWLLVERGIVAKIAAWYSTGIAAYSRDAKV
jgi:hypothetical protein